jgi:gliding motility-associated-like protein/uncharacterized repeat protein (TIGR01451 family)
LAGFTSSATTLAPSQTATSTATYTITQADLVKEKVINIATAIAITDLGISVSALDSAQVVIDPDALSPQISLQKSANLSQVQNSGEVIKYTLIVTNTGLVDLTNVIVSDPLLGMNTQIPSLSIGQASTLTANYTVTWKDVLAQKPIQNTATATGVSPLGVSVQDLDSAEVGIFCDSKTLLTGVIKNVSTGNGIADVPVILSSSQGQKQVVLTDSNGRYLFEKVAPGSYTVEVFDRNLNKTQDLFAVNGNSSSVELRICQYISRDFDYGPSGDRYIQGFVWYDLNGDAIQNEWYDADGDGQVTKNALVSGQPFDLSKWEWFDLNGDGSYNGPQNFGELNKAGFGNPNGQNLDIKGPNGYVAKESVADFGFWKHQLPVGQALGEFTITLIPDQQWANNGSALVSSGLIKVLPEAGGRMIDARTKVVCEFTTPQVQTKILAAGNIADFDYGVTCRVVSDKVIVANDDVYGPIFISFGGPVGNILENDQLDGKKPLANEVIVEITNFGGLLGASLDDLGNLILIPGLNQPGTYTLTYVLKEADFPENTDTATITLTLINDQVDLSVEKTSLDAEIYEGDEFTYFITLRNLSDTPAKGVKVADQLPAKVSYLGFEVVNEGDPLIQINGPIVSGQTLTWDIPFLPALSEVILQLTVKAGDPGLITNVVRISSAEDELNPLNNEAQDTNEILPFRIPNVITPNEDGDNDTFEIKGIDKFSDTKLVIFNRLGDHILEAENYQNDWSAEGLVAGTYFYVLTAIDRNGDPVEFKGWIQVIKR